jgi:membrane protein
VDIRRARGARSDVGEPADRFPGAHARTPGEIPRRGWLQVVVRAFRRAGEDRVPLVAAGIAFFGFLALFPTLIAAVLVYGLVADPASINGHVATLTEILPAEGEALVSRQMESLVQSDRQGLSIGLGVSVLVALWSVSIGVAHLITAVNLAYAETTRVGFLRRRTTAFAFTIGAIVTFVALIALVAVFPVVVDTDGIPGILKQVARWAALLVIATVALGVIYRHAPARTAPRVPWVSTGAVVATVMWLLVSVGFSLYVSWFGAYAETYGALAGGVVVLVWMWLAAMAVLLGAEINAEAEHQTDADTTTGPERPRGERGAVKADTAIGRPDPGEI